MADALDELVQSEEFENADPETQEKMLNNLYNYAAEEAKAELFDDYEISSTAAKNEELLDAGLSLGEVITMRVNGADADDYLDFVEAGMDSDDAYELAHDLAEVEPVAGEDRVADVQLWRTCVNFSNNEGVQLAALAGKMTAEQFAKCQIAYDFDVTPDHYVGYYEIRADYDKDGNGSYSNTEVKTAIDSMRGLTNNERAVLWQLATGSKSAKNNPYSTKVGQQVIDARNKE